MVTFRSIGSLFAIFIGSTSLAGNSPTVSRVNIPSYEGTSVAAGSNCGECVNGGFWCASNDHQVTEGGAEMIGLHDYCIEGRGCTGHPVCGGEALGPTPESMERARTVEELADILSAALPPQESPGRWISLNPLRRAVDIYGCDGVTLIGHYPLPDGQVLGAGLPSAAR